MKVAISRESFPSLSAFEKQFIKWYLAEAGKDNLLHSVERLLRIERF
jgi:hypothetical protein